MENKGKKRIWILIAIIIIIGVIIGILVIRNNRETIKNNNEQTSGLNESNKIESDEPSVPSTPSVPSEENSKVPENSVDVEQPDKGEEPSNSGEANQITKKILEIPGYELDKDFSFNITEYNLTVDKNEIEIKCNFTNKSSGCNTKLNLKDKETYNHAILVNVNGEVKSYIIHINNKAAEKFIKITNVDGNPKEWTNKDATIRVTAQTKTNTKILYSFDGGKTWKDTNEITITSNQILNILAKDANNNITEPKTIKVEKIDKDKPIVKLEIASKGTDKIVLKAISSDKTSGVAKISFNDGTYNTTDTYTIAKPGSYKAKVIDNAGNESEYVSITINDNDFVKKEPQKYSRKVKLESNGSAIESTELSCESYSQTCEVALPTITQEDGTVVGWSTKKDSKTAEYESGEIIKLNSDKTLYAITYKTLIAVFKQNGATKISSASQSCDVYNTETTCRVTTPKIVRENGKVFGWNSSSLAKTAEFEVEKEITLTKNATYYAITSKDLKVSYNENGATSIGKTEDSCTIYNTDKTCTISKAPTITRTSGTVIGWSGNANATSESSDIIKADSTITLKADTTYLYAITYKTLTATFNKNGATSIGATTLSCNMYNKNKNCTIDKAPSITRDNWIKKGWNISSTATSGTEVGKSLNLTANTTYYAITYKTLTANFEKNGATSIGNTILSCPIYNTETSCTPESKMPTITKSGGTVVGWNTKATATSETSGTIKPEAAITLKESTDAVKYYAITYKTLTATFNKNGATSIGATSSSCDLYNTETSCTLEEKLPTITRDGWTIVGWNKSASADTSQASVGSAIKISSDTNYYAITTKLLLATFNKNGADEIGAVSRTCSIYNTETSCNVKAPSITREKLDQWSWEIIGWNTNANSTDATSGTIKADSDIALTKSSAIYYAITKMTASVFFNVNGINEDNDECSYYNKETSCEITPPEATLSNWEMLGWDIDADATDPMVKVGANVVVSKFETYYAIFTKTITITFEKGEAESISVESQTYDVYSRDNIADVILPTFRNNGAYNVVWKSTDGKEYIAGHTYNFDSDITLTATSVHPCYKSSENNVSKTRNFTISNRKTVNNVLFEYEDGIPLEAIANHMNFLDSLKNDMPYLFAAPGKVFVMLEDTYLNYSSPTSYGLTHYAGVYFFVDLKYDTKYDVISENATIHELAHAWDGNYNNNTVWGKNIISSGDLLQSLYQEHYNAERLDGSPSADSSVEFFAATVTNYYWFILEKNLDRNNGNLYIYKEGEKYTSSDKARVTAIINKYKE